MNPYVLLLIFLLVVLGVVGMVMGLNALLGPRVKPTAAKLEPFECGAQPIQHRNVRRLSVKYYPIAILFLLFDLETVLLFVWAGAFDRMASAALALGSFLFFMIVLTLVFAWLWKEGALEWR